MNVEPGSTISKIARFFIASGFAALNLINVEGGPAGHRQDFAGLGIHKDPCGIVRLEFSKGIVELRLQDGLQAHVNRQLNIHSMAGRLFLTSVDDDFAAGAITFDVTKAIDPAR